jgi:uncharacterized protein YjbI with pentapeptide repeats
MKPKREDTSKEAPEAPKKKSAPSEGRRKEEPTANVRDKVEKTLSKEPPTKEEAIAMLKAGRIRKWNSLRTQFPEWIPGLSWADLSEADLSGAKLYEVNLYQANLSKANLFRVDLSGAKLSWADLSEADLSGAKLYGVNLYQADLSKADLSKADLSEADLFGADLSRADLKNAKNLVPEQLAKALFFEAMNIDPQLFDATVKVIRKSCQQE